MNKKIVFAILGVVGICAIGGAIFASQRFGGDDANNAGGSGEIISNDKKGDEMVDDESVVVYFSATGNTRKVAEMISEKTGSDIVEIVPAEAYTDEDLDYNESNSRANVEQNDPNARPGIRDEIDVAEYDTIFLGYPIWWGDAPRIILTFLDGQDLSGKTVIPFCTSGSSGISRSVDYFKENYQGVNWLEGKRLTGSESDVESWLSGLGVE